MAVGGGVFYYYSYMYEPEIDLKEVTCPKSYICLHLWYLPDT